MIWRRASCRKEITFADGPRGNLMLGDALVQDLSEYYGQVQCVYLDPPYYTGDRFTFRMRVGRDGWSGKGRTLILPTYDDFSGDSKAVYLKFLRGAIILAHRLLTNEGSFFLHMDYRANAHARLICDDVFGEDNFVNEIVWSYQTGGRSKRYFSRKHDTIFLYGKSQDRYFDISQVPCRRKKDHTNHMKRNVDEQGRHYRTIRSGGRVYIYYDDEPSYPDDVWADVSQMQQKDPQRTGYATQKPQALLDRIIRCSTRKNDLVADFMCGSGTALVSAADNNRRFLGMDDCIHALSVTRKRLKDVCVEVDSPLSSVTAMVDAAVLAGIGFYDVSLNAYTVSGDAFDNAVMEPAGKRIVSLDAVDQWYAGLLNNEEFQVYASGVRTKQSPDLPKTLKVPLLRGTVALMIIDVLGNRTLWAASSQV